MLRTLLLLLISSLVIGADLSEFRMTTSVGVKPAKPRAALGQGREVTVFPGDDVLAQVANGDGWKTQIYLVNLSSVRLPFTIDFWRSDGSFWEIAIVGLGTGDQFTGSLDPRATIVAMSRA